MEDFIETMIFCAFDVDDAVERAKALLEQREKDELPASVIREALAETGA